MALASALAVVDVDVDDVEDVLESVEELASPPSWWRCRLTVVPLASAVCVDPELPDWAEPETPGGGPGGGPPIGGPPDCNCCITASMSEASWLTVPVSPVLALDEVLLAVVELLAALVESLLPPCCAATRIDCRSLASWSNGFVLPVACGDADVEVVVAALLVVAPVAAALCC